MQRVFNISFLANAGSTCGRNAWILGTALIALGFSAGCGSSYPKCDNDDDCVHEIDGPKKGTKITLHDYCVNGMCQQCRTTKDCKAGLECDKGFCREPVGYCKTNLECRADEYCKSNRCTKKDIKNWDPNANKWNLDEKDASSICTLDAVYFDFDSEVLSTQARDMLSRNASCIKKRSVKSVQVTGFTDPRGTEEYNLALGERRARSASEYLKTLGASTELQVSSVGEELARGTDDASYSQDRKVEFIGKN